VCLAVVGWVLGAAGQEGRLPDSGTRTTLDQAILTAYENNPSLAAARLRVSAAEFTPAREAAFPNPYVSVSAEDRASDFRVVGANTVRADVEQTFPWFGKRSLRRQVARADAQSVRFDADAQKLDLKLRVTEAAYGLHSARSTASLLLSELDLLTQLESVTRTRYATGTADQQDVAKAQAEVTMLKQRLTDVRSRETSLKARLNTLMGRSADAELGEVAVPPVTAWPQPELSNWLARADSSNPELAKARVMADKTRLKERLMRREYFPDLKLMAEITRMRDEDETFVMLGVGVDLPLRYEAARAGVVEANRMARAAEYDREAVRQETAYMIQDIASCCASAWQNLGLIRSSLLPQAEARYKASEASYGAGKGGFLDLLESERFLLGVRVMAVTTEAEVATQMARLERLLAGPVGGAVTPVEGGK
jgi:outer membrane protein TolC